MTEAERLRILKQMVQDEVVLAAPDLVEMRFEVRTVGFPAPFAEMQKAVPDIVGSFLVEWGYDVLDERQEEFQTFLKDAEKALAGADILPKGVRYLGTYVVTAGRTGDSGSYRTIWGYDDYKAMEKFAEERTKKGSPLAQALSGFREYRDRGRHPRHSVSIYQRAAGLAPY